MQVHKITLKLKRTLNHYLSKFWEIYEPPYSSSYVLNSTITVLLQL